MRFGVGAPPPDDASPVWQVSRVERLVTEDESTVRGSRAEFDEAMGALDIAGKTVVAPSIHICVTGLVVRDAAPLVSGRRVQDHMRATVGTDPVQFHAR